MAIGKKFPTPLRGEVFESFALIRFGAIMDFQMWTFIIVLVLLILALAGFFIRR